MTLIVLVDECGERVGLRLVVRGSKAFSVERRSNIVERMIALPRIRRCLPKLMARLWSGNLLLLSYCETPPIRSGWKAIVRSAATKPLCDTVLSVRLVDPSKSCG